MRALDFIYVARTLALRAKRGRPPQIELRRAVSSTYYALFHCLAATGAKTLVGRAGAGPARRQTYRALQHGTTAKRCRNATVMNQFPPEIQTFANCFVEMQAKREDADYDPDAVFLKSDVVQDIDVAERTIQGLESASRRDRQAFAVYVLLHPRGVGA